MIDSPLAPEPPTTGPGKSLSGVLRPSPIMNAWIRTGEVFLSRIAGYGPGEVLNIAPAGSVFETDTDPAAGLKKALDEVKIAALDETGLHVDYTRLRTSPAYTAYRLKTFQLHAFDPASLPSDKARTAFWINLYNALVMDAVIAFGVQRSVVEGRLGMLAFFRRAAYNVAGLRVSLDDIEQGILRGNRGHPFLPGLHFTSKNPRLSWALPLDPRVHFALNCASRSCPPIQVYTAEKLDIQLELATHNFVNSNVKLDSGCQVLVLSSIFRWFENDFGGRTGLITFLCDHLPSDVRHTCLSQNRNTLRLKYEPYDWSLNSTEL